MTNNYFIYNFDYKTSGKYTNANVIFIPGNFLDINQLQQELRIFYTNYLQADRTVIICGGYLKDVEKIVDKEKNTIFKYVPTLEQESFYNNLHILQFSKEGNLSHSSSPQFKKIKGFKDFKNKFYNEGLKILFKSRGGLVESSHSHHHFVFPSGKHSAKFLRTANVLVYSSEISFIAFGILKFFKNRTFKIIYCDTSSINVIAYEALRILNEFDDKYDHIPINSFQSYSGIYNNDLVINSNSLILISASTSGNIVNKLLEKHPNITSNDIVIIYYLENNKPNNVVMEQVLCNLTMNSEADENGIAEITGGKEGKCNLCDNGSFALKVTGDVFLLEQPKVNSLVIGVDDIKIKNLFNFTNQFRSIKKNSTVLKVNYRENKEEVQVNSKYEIFIDFDEIIDNLNNYKNYKKKLNDYIDQYVPGNLDSILYLNDSSSKKLADYILDKIRGKYKDNQIPKLVSQSSFDTIDKNATGSILIVGSCISNGHNLLYLSRALRNYKLRVVYFVGINRYPNEKQNSFLKTNLKYGKYGRENSSFIEVEQISCVGLEASNSWIRELDFLKGKSRDEDDDEVLSFINNRISKIEEGYSNKKKGLTSNVFLPIIYPIENEKILSIRKNSAFFSDDKYYKNVVQSDVLFCISTVINGMRNSRMQQSSFTRNIICPTNFNRYNDGIIQASILRSARSEELDYTLSSADSMRMRDILITLCRYRKSTQGEALLEFLFAISTGKLKLKIDDLNQIVSELKSEKNKIINFYYRSIIAYTKENSNISFSF